MSKQNQKLTGIGFALAFIAMLFVVVGLLYATGVFAPENEAVGFLANLRYGAERWAENPQAVAVVVTVIIGVFGFLENVVFEPSQEYSLKKLVETFLVYEALILVFSQALPIELALTISVLIDIVRRIAKRLGVAISLNTLSPTPPPAS